MMRPMSTLPSLSHLLFTQGFGTRRVCAGLIEQGHVKVQGSIVRDPAQGFDPEGLVVEVQGQLWPVHEQAYLVMNKPLGVECSQKPKHHPSVYTLLPAPLRLRGVQTVGRLDHDTSGLLLFTDDGKWIHRLTSPKSKVAKVYQAQTAREIDQNQIDALLKGVVLRDDPEPVRAVSAHQIDTHTLELTLTEGKYHQVRRMVAATGNHVESLSRTRIGDLSLQGLDLGQWRWLNPDEHRMLYAG